MDSSVENKIRKFIIKSAPYGELAEVLEDLKKISPNLDENNQDIQEFIRENNEEHLALIRDNTNQVLICASKASYVNGQYIDQKRNAKYRVNNLTKIIEAKEDFQPNITQNLKQYRDFIEKGLEKYQQDYYKDDHSVVSVVAKGDDTDFVININMTAKHLNLKNYYGGEWLSSWTVTKDKLQGSIKVNTHYFEEGNVQLKQNRDFTIDFELLGDIQPESQYIVEQITKHEEEVFQGLHQVYESMPNQFFKAMRRALPMTGEKIRWEVQFHKITSDLFGK